MTDESLAVVEPVVINTPMPIHDGADMVKALDAYKDLQNKLDQKMPEAIVTIRGKQYRTKQYWRTIARAFNLSVTTVDGTDQRIMTDDGDWGYLVTYRATAPNGSSADGDGACMASEKSGGSDTIHNVRAHCQTRAFNRAVSNLVGFGEVSADEMPRDGSGAPQRPSERSSPAPKTSTPKKTTKKPTKKAPAKVSPETPETPEERTRRLAEMTKPSLDDLDIEFIEKVDTVRTLKSGTVLYHVFSNLRKYTCLDENARQMAEESMNRKCAVSIDWKVGETKSDPPRTFNGINSIALRTDVSYESGEVTVEETTDVGELTADEIPF